ncbi:hypothetical protein G5714_002722 [Onychostoma macrolepis]|uniref:Uncharacterized protein n=1 Tax=Onychostoma macrolepis TaxID=369639 RepID=A0A7J6D7I7_9TELE|nr:hypothetical protein G5714_002722 [Onychostoma macrolepis]
MPCSILSLVIFSFLRYIQRVFELCLDSGRVLRPEQNWLYCWALDRDPLYPESPPASPSLQHILPKQALLSPLERDPMSHSNVLCHLLALREQWAACLWGGDAGERGSGIGPPPTKNKRLSDGGPADPSLAKWELCSEVPAFRDYEKPNERAEVLSRLCCALCPSALLTNRSAESSGRMAGCQSERGTESDEGGQCVDRRQHLSLRKCRDVTAPPRWHLRRVQTAPSGESWPLYLGRRSLRWICRSLAPRSGQALAAAGVGKGSEMVELELLTLRSRPCQPVHVSSHQSPRALSS